MRSFCSTIRGFTDTYNRDADFGSLFKDVSLLANFSLPAACAVSQVVVGYNVSVDISMSESAAKQMSDLYSKTTSAGGSISIFGSEFNHISPDIVRPRLT